MGISQTTKILVIAKIYVVLFFVTPLYCIMSGCSYDTGLEHVTEGEILVHAMNEHNYMILIYLLLLVLSSTFVLFLRVIVRILHHIMYYQILECAIDCSYCFITCFFLVVLSHFNGLQIIFNVLYVITENQFNVLVCNQRSLTAASSKSLFKLLISAVDALQLVPNSSK